MTARTTMVLCGESRARRALRACATGVARAREVAAVGVFAVAVALALAVTGALPPARAHAAPASMPSRTHATAARVVVRTASADLRSLLQSALEAHDVGVRRSYGEPDALIVDAPAAALEPYAVLLAAGTAPREDGRVRAAWTPNDPLLGQQWGLPAIGAPRAWDVVRAGKAQVVAMLDTGVALRHRDLADAIDTANDWDFVNNDATAADDEGHGTNTAGIVAAVADNGLGIAGAAAGVRILPIKVLDANGDGWESDVADGIRYAADRGASVINISLGGPRRSDYLIRAVDYARAKGCVIVAAAGNDGDYSAFYPAGYSGVVGVGAVDSALDHADFSNMGKDVDLVAPGTDIITTNRLGGYEVTDGTSMSAPFVSATCALLKAARPTLRGEDLERAITLTARDLGARGRDDVFGFGLVDAASAVSAYADRTPPVSAASGVVPEWVSAETVTVRIDASDAISGIDRVLYRIAGVTRTYETPFEISDEGETRVEYWAIDRAGNTESPKSVTARIDRTPPGVGVSVHSRDRRSDVALVASDALSGVAGTSYRLNGLDAWTDGQQFTIAGLGWHVVEFAARDNAGNSSPIEVRSLLVAAENPSAWGSEPDITPPTTRLVGLPQSWVGDPPRLRIVAADERSGVARSWYAVGGDAPILFDGTPLSIPATQSGEVTVTCWSQDHAGNVEEPQDAIVRIDRQRPPAPGAPAWQAITGTTVELWWPPVIDVQSGTAAYDVLVDGRVATRVDDTAAQLTGLKRGQAYRFEIRAIDAVGNASAPGGRRDLRMPLSDGRVLVSGPGSEELAFATAIAGPSMRTASVVVSSIREPGRLTWAEASHPATSPAGVHLIGKSISVQFSGVGRLSGITLPIDERITGIRARSLGVYVFREGAWQRMPAAVDTKRRRVTASLDSPGPIALGGSLRYAATRIETKSRVTATVGRNLTLSARLRDARGRTLSGRKLVLRALVDGRWVEVGRLADTRRDPGVYRGVMTVKRSTPTRYRIVFAGDSLHAGSERAFTLRKR